MKKLLMAALIVALLALPLAGLAQTGKDETVYALLDASGEARTVLVVSHFDTPQAGEYVDYGAYKSMAAMLTDDVPVVEGDEIRWTLPADDAGFYAVGEPQAAELPFALEIAYTLDGAEIAPGDLAGQSGRVGLTLAVRPNPKAAESLRAGYLAQVQVALDTQIVSDVDAAGATQALVGRTNTLTYMVLPGQEGRFALSFDARDFAMNAITMACTSMDAGDMLGLDVDALSGQVTELTDGARQLAEGGTALAGGMDTLAAGVAAGNGTEETAHLADGSQALAEGVAGYVEGVSQTLGGMTQLSVALETTAASGESLAAGIEQLQAGLAPLLAGLPEAQRAALDGQLTALGEGVGQYTQGVSQIAGQTGALVSGASALGESGGTLAAGATELHEGVVALADGLGQVSAQAATLAEAQTALADGLDAAVAELGDLAGAGEPAEAVYSFVSPEHPVRSVQFVYSTEAITLPVAEAEVAEEAAPETFWDRLMDLF